MVIRPVPSLTQRPVEAGSMAGLPSTNWTGRLGRAASENAVVPSVCMYFVQIALP
jgi:hypothetical protein